MNALSKEQIGVWKELSGGYDDLTEPPTCWDAGDIIFLLSN